MSNTNDNIAFNANKQHHKSDKITTSAPGKVILFGEHFVVHGANAILCAINRHVHVTAMRSSDIQIQSELGNLKYDSCKHDIMDVNPTLRPLYYIIKETRKITKSDSGVTLQIRSDIPPGAGLGSSSACCVAGTAAVLKVLGDKDTYQISNIINMAIDAERTVFPNVSGADTAISALGGLITYNTKTGYEKIKINRDPKFGLVIINSKIPHNTKTIVNQVAKFKNENPSMFRELYNKETQLVSTVLDILRNSKDRGNVQSTKASKLGQLASLNQEYLKTINVSNQTLDQIVNFVNLHTYGAKITGAGGGGCIIGFTDTESSKTDVDISLSQASLSTQSQASLSTQSQASLSTQSQASLSTQSQASTQSQSSEPSFTQTDTRSQLKALRHISEKGYECFVADIDKTGLNTF